MENVEQSGVPSGGAESVGEGAADLERVAPRSGAPARGGAPPFLDKEYRNVPRGISCPSWSPKQWKTRRAVMDRLRYWQSMGYQCLWVTLTSAPNSPKERLRKDFQVLRKRIDRDLGFSGFEYVCVDTLEGHGVLHMIWAWKDPNPRKRASFYIPFDWLQEQWNGIHGAFHVNVKRIGSADKDARRLSRYIVAQYCGDQDGLVRLSQSRMAISLSRMREGLLRMLKALPERYKQARALRNEGQSSKEFSRLFNGWFWAVFRNAWDDLVRGRSCEAFGVQLVWWGGELQRV